jgi:hypothetical protein
VVRIVTVTVPPAEPLGQENRTAASRQEHVARALTASAER